MQSKTSIEPAYVLQKIADTVRRSNNQSKLYVSTITNSERTICLTDIIAHVLHKSIANTSTTILTVLRNWMFRKYSIAHVLHKSIANTDTTKLTMLRNSTFRMYSIEI